MAETRLTIVLNGDRRMFKFDWRPKRQSSVRPDNSSVLDVHPSDNRLLQMIVRARAWHEALIEGKFESAEKFWLIDRFASKNSAAAAAVRPS